MIKKNKDPRVVVSILTWNKIDLLKNCLESVFQNTVYENYRVCVFEQGSEDGTKEYLKSLGDKVDVVYSPENIGFVRGNNEIIKKYSDSDIVMLNNDTIVTNGWLQALVDCAYSDEKIGIVGAKLVYPDGTLQEAGGEIYADGRGTNIGKYDDPDRKKYNVVREVDYCSAACLYVKRSLLNIVGGFDVQFAPAYYEDTDLCFSSRRHGYKVMYQPKCKIIHHEGASSGVDILSGFKKYQEINRPKFVRKWEDVLKDHSKSYWEAEKKEGKDQILVISRFPPMYDKASGEFRLYQMVKILNKHYNVVFLAGDTRNSERYVEHLRELGITVYCNDVQRFPYLDDHNLIRPLDLEKILQHNTFKAAFLEFYYTADLYIDYIRRYSPHTVLITDSVDVHFLRESREAELKQDTDLLRIAERNKKKELSVYDRSDTILTVTEEDMTSLLQECQSYDIRVLPNIHEPSADVLSMKRRDGLLFVGGFSHPPNVDAMLYFCSDIFPLIKKGIPDINLTIVGNKPPPEITDLQDRHIRVTGYVPETKPYLDSALISIAPLRYGAGMKGKIGEAMASGLPVVTTSIGAEGMGLKNDEDVLIADSPEDFAQCVLRLYNDKSTWDRLSENGLDFIRDNYSVRAVERNILGILSFLPEPKIRKSQRYNIDIETVEEVSEIKAAGKVTAIVPVKSDLDEAKRCVDSILKNTDNLQEIIVIKQGSSSDMEQWLERTCIHYIQNNQGDYFETACMKAVRMCCSEYAALLHGDTIVTPHWDTRLIDHLENNALLAVAPICTRNHDYDTFYQLETIAWQVYQSSKGKVKKKRNITGSSCILISLPKLNETCIPEKVFSASDSQSILACLKHHYYMTALAQDVIIHHDEDYVKPRKSLPIHTGTVKRLSVIISGFTDNENLIATLESLKGQSLNHKEFEIIIMGEGDNNHVKKMIKQSYSGLNIQIIHKGRGSLNRAVEMSRGRYILYLKENMLAHENLLHYHFMAHEKKSQTEVTVIGDTFINPEWQCAGVVEFLTSQRKQKNNTALSFDPYYADSISVKKETVKKMGFTDNLVFGWQVREYLYRTRLDGIPLVTNDNAIVFPCTDLYLKDFYSEQEQAGRGTVFLALQHPNRIWGLQDSKEKCMKDYIGKEKITKMALQISRELELLPVNKSDTYMLGNQRLLDTLYTVILNYHYAKGINSALVDVEGKGWFDTYIEVEYEDKKDIMDKVNAENEMYEHLLQCVFHQNEGNIDRSLEHAAYAEKALPEAPHPYFYLGECSLKSGSYDNAERAYDTCVQNQLKYSEYTREVTPAGDYVINNFYFALSCMKQGKYDKVIKIVTGLIENKFIGKVDQDFICYLYLARCYEHTGRIDEAVDYYRRVLDIDECHESTVNSLVMLLMKLNKYEEAKTKLKRFAEVYAGDVKIMPAKDGMLIAVMNRGGKKVTLHSRYRPLREAEDNVSRSGNLDDKIIVQIGIGLGYPVRAVWNKVSKETPVIAVERNAALGNLALLHGLLERMKSGTNLEILTGHVEHQRMMDAIEEMLKKFPEREVMIIKHGPSYNLYPFFYDDLQTIIKEHIEKRENKCVGV